MKQPKPRKKQKYPEVWIDLLGILNVMYLDKLEWYNDLLGVWATDPLPPTWGMRKNWEFICEIKD
jgi:hypothetical protein